MQPRPYVAAPCIFLPSLAVLISLFPLLLSFLISPFSPFLPCSFCLPLTFSFYFPAVSYLHPPSFSFTCLRASISIIFLAYLPLSYSVNPTFLFFPSYCLLSFPCSTFFVSFRILSLFKFVTLPFSYL